MLIVEVDNRMYPNPQNNNRKCGDEGSAHRVFTLRESNLQVDKCKEECAKNEHCVAFSGRWDSGAYNWCAGCNVKLTTEHKDAIAFTKTGEVI